MRTPPFDWTCGHCGTQVTVTAEHYHSGYRHLSVAETKSGDTALVFSAISCPNADCRELTLAIRLAEYKPSLGHAYPIGTAGDAIREWLLLPQNLDGDAQTT
jgi:hypothetical protein